MRIAILMTNTDESAFAQRHPKDGQKFESLMHRVRPDWRFEVFPVKDGIFPTDVEGFDGIIITGSPASVHDDAAWIAQLEALVLESFGEGIPMFGACFGHQIIATALGGTVEGNPGGWVIGTVNKVFTGQARTLPIYAAHKEQVTVLPPQAGRTATGPGCPIAGFAISNRVLTTQYHPEMSHDFVHALMDEFADDLGLDVVTRGRASMSQAAATDELAEWIAAFFEAAPEQQTIS